MRLDLRILRWVTIAAVSLLLVSSSTASTTTKSTKPSSSSHKSTKLASSGKSTKSSGSKSSKSGKKSAKTVSHGQRGIDPTRTREIQEALIREHYMTGEPTGSWDQSTKDALARYQEANGWQTKSVPDSRALIKLGLGPDKKGLLNPDTAVMTSPHELGATQGGVLPGGSVQQ